MEIKAKCKLDIETMKALKHLLMFGKADPKKRMRFWAVAYAIFLAIIVLEIILFDSDLILFVLMGLVIFFYLMGFYLYFLSPKVMYKALAKMKEAENEYIFYDDTIKIFTKSAEYNAEAESGYSLFVKVFETSKYFFLYQTNNQVYAIDKSTIKGGTAEDIRNKLTPFVKDKYIICKY